MPENTAEEQEERMSVPVDTAFPRGNAARYFSSAPLFGQLAASLGMKRPTALPFFVTMTSCPAMISFRYLPKLFCICVDVAVEIPIQTPPYNAYYYMEN